MKKQPVNHTVSSLTRFRMSETERLKFWSAERGQFDFRVSCPHCGATVLWVESTPVETTVAYEHTETTNED